MARCEYPPRGPATRWPGNARVRPWLAAQAIRGRLGRGIVAGRIWWARIVAHPPAHLVRRICQGRRAQRRAAFRRMQSCRSDDHGARHRRAEVISSSENIERRSEEHTSELQSLMRISYAVFCLKKKRI